MNKIKDTVCNMYMKNNILRLKNTHKKKMVEIRIKEENVGHGRDPHLLLIALIVM